jgi:hypothetical protein
MSTKRKTTQMALNRLITEKQTTTLQKAGYKDSELNGLTVAQASKLLHYVAHNGWKRPTAAQIEAIAAGELIEDKQASSRAAPLARIPSTEELENLTQDMPPAKAYAFEEAMYELKGAVGKGKEAILEQGQALCFLKQVCNHRQWGKLLEAIELPRTTAHRQMQVAKAHAVADSNLAKIFKSKGIKLDAAMSAKDLQLVHRAAEVARTAKEEMKSNSDLFHHGTNPPESDDPFSDLGASLRHEAEVDKNVEAKVGAFLDQELLSKVRPTRRVRPIACLRAPCESPAEIETGARDIAATVIERLQALPAERRNEVWRLVLQHLAAEGFLPNKPELVSAAA